MKLTIEQSTEAGFIERRTWRYEPPYDFYDEDDEPVLNPERHFDARDEDGRLVGFYYFEWKGDALEYGLGLRPDLTGRGGGLVFVLAGLEFARAKFVPRRIILNVAAFNERAIRVYERAGFRVTGSHMRHFDEWGDVEFIEMEEER